MRKEKEKKIDGTLLVTVWILLGLGLVILYSASAYNGRVRFHDPAYYFKKQLFASALGVIGMYAVAKIDYRRLFALAPWFYAASLALSTAVLFFGGLQALREFGLIAGTFFLPLLKCLDSQKAGFVLPPRLFGFVQQAATGCRVHEACPPVGDAPIA